MASSGGEQARIIDEDHDPIHLYYRGLQDKKLRDKTLSDNRKIRNFKEILDQLARQTGEHVLEEISLDENPRMFLKQLLQGYPDRDDTFSTALINNFCDSLKTRAREQGTYAVLIVMESSVIICHTDAKEKTVTKEAGVIERLLDADNVSRYIRFIQDSDGQIRVQHYERRLPISDSLSDWLGLERSELSFREIGDIKIYTEIDDSTAVFQYTREEFEQKFLAEDSDYGLTGDEFETPNDQYPIDYLRIDRERFDTTEEFLQRFNTLYYDLENQRIRYQDIGNSMEAWVDSVYEKRNKVVKGSNEEIIASKSHDKLEILYTHSQIELAASWKIKLKKKFMNGSELRLWHAGMPYNEPPVQIGGFIIQNPIGISEDIESVLHRLAEYIRSDSSGSFISNILSYTLFASLSDWTKSPISYFFEQLSGRYENDLKSDGIVMEEENDIIEYKAPEWIPEGDDNLAKKIIKEVNNDLKVVIIGIDESERKCRLVNGDQFKSDRTSDIANRVQTDSQAIEHCLVHRVPVNQNGSLLTAVAIKETSDNFNLDML